MLSQEKINEVFEYYNIHSEVDSTSGNWAVSGDGDVINVEHKYPIYSWQVQSTTIEEWTEHLATKTWFNNEQNDFKSSYARAEEILQIIR